ncbi:hypothetical protein PHISP_03897 [Aspergillus sp. HF37]|nr:hypothetical protein PHISP_03897 [Aspergillus sp. HF37]
MTEPEDVEEDLFADLYEADDTANNASAAAPAPLQPDPTASGVPPQPIGGPVNQFGGLSQFDSQEPQNPYQVPLDDGQQNGAGNLYPAWDSNAAVAPEPAAQDIRPITGTRAGTGIKEDG